MTLQEYTKLFFIFLFLFLSGILTYSLFVSVISFLVIGVIFSFVIYILFFKKYSFVLIISILFFAFGGFRTYQSEKQDISFLGEKKISGRITSNPKFNTFNQSFKINTYPNEDGIKAIVLVRAPNTEKFFYGDRVVFNANCIIPKNFTTTIGTEFDYKNYLKKDHILSICQTTEVTLKKRPSFSFLRELYSFSQKIQLHIKKVFIYPSSAIISGMFLGERSDLSKEIQTDFTKTGTIHLLALSGFNITLVALFCERLFCVFLKRKYALLLAFFSIIVFILMTGAQASAVRAGIMVSVALSAKFFYRSYSPLRALCIAGAVMTFINPYTFLYDVSFHLSFLATFGILTLEKPIRSFFSFLYFDFLKTLISVSLAAQIMTFPYVLFVFQSISFSGFLANIIISPFIPLIMLCSFLAGILFPISQIFAFPLVVLSEYCIDKMLSIISYFANLEKGFLIIETIPLHLVIFIYILIGIFIYSYRKKIDF